MSLTAVQLDKRALQATAAASALLVLKMYITLSLQGAARIQAGSRPPEDQKLFPKAGNQSFDGSRKFAGKEDDPKAKYLKEKECRWLRIVLNDLENIPMGLAVAWGGLLTPYNADAHTAMVLAFAIGRVLHTFSYAYGLQPHRGIFWFVGVVSVVGIAANSLAGALLLA